MFTQMRVTFARMRVVVRMSVALAMRVIVAVTMGRMRVCEVTTVVPMSNARDDKMANHRCCKQQYERNEALKGQSARHGGQFNSESLPVQVRTTKSQNLHNDAVKNQTAFCPSSNESQTRIPKAI